MVKIMAHNNILDSAQMFLFATLKEKAEIKI